MKRVQKESKTDFGPKSLRWRQVILNLWILSCSFVSSSENLCLDDRSPMGCKTWEEGEKCNEDECWDFRDTLFLLPLHFSSSVDLGERNL